MKRGKKLGNKSWLIFVLNPIGQEDGASFLDQSRGKVKQIKVEERLVTILRMQSLTADMTLSIYLITLCDWLRNLVLPSDSKLKPNATW